MMNGADQKKLVRETRHVTVLNQTCCRNGGGDTLLDRSSFESRPMKNSVEGLKAFQKFSLIHINPRPDFNHLTVPGQDRIRIRMIEKLSFFFGHDLGNGFLKRT